MMQHFLRDMVIVQPTVSLERLLEVFACSIAPGRQHVADTAIEALHHPIRLRPSRLDPAVLDAACCSGSVKEATKRFSMVLSVSEILAWISHENFRLGT